MKAFFARLLARLHALLVGDLDERAARQRAKARAFAKHGDHDGAEQWSRAAERTQARARHLRDDVQ
jgi:hypothetical protein